MLLTISAAWLLWSGCGREADRTGASLPGFDAALWSLLAAEDSLGFARLAAEISADRLIGSREIALEAVFGEEGGQGSEADSSPDRILAILDSNLARAHRLPAYARETEFLKGLPTDSAKEILTLRRRQRDVFEDVDLGTAAKQQEIRMIIGKLMDAGDTRGILEGMYRTGVLWHSISRLILCFPGPDIIIGRIIEIVTGSDRKNQQSGDHPQCELFLFHFDLLVSKMKYSDFYFELIQGY